MNTCVLYRIGSSYTKLQRYKQIVRHFSYDYYNECGELRLPKNADVVICGGGVMGASVAYHLACIGWGPRTVVLEQGKYVLNLSHGIIFKCSVKM